MEIKIIGWITTFDEGCFGVRGNGDQTIEERFVIDPKTTDLTRFVRAFANRWAEQLISFSRIIVARA